MCWSRPFDHPADVTPDSVLPIGQLDQLGSVGKDTAGKLATWVIAIRRIGIVESDAVVSRLYLEYLLVQGLP